DESLLNRLENYFLNKALPLGHGTVLSNPDKPYLVWGYTNGHGERIERNNPKDFIDAADHMCKAMQCFRAGDIRYSAPGLPPRDRDTIWQFFTNLVIPDEKVRHAAWLEDIKKGFFSFGPETASYVAEGEGSWKHYALGVPDADDDLAYRAEF